MKLEEQLKDLKIKRQIVIDEIRIFQENLKATNVKYFKNTYAGRIPSYVGGIRYIDPEAAPEYVLHTNNDPTNRVRVFILGDWSDMWGGNPNANGGYYWVNVALGDGKWFGEIERVLEKGGYYRGPVMMTHINCLGYDDGYGANTSINVTRAWLDKSLNIGCGLTESCLQLTTEGETYKLFYTKDPFLSWNNRIKDIFLTYGSLDSIEGQIRLLEETLNNYKNI